MIRNDRREAAEARTPQAKILPFRPRQAALPPVSAAAVDAASGWYHDAAIRDAETQDRKR